SASRARRRSRCRRRGARSGTRIRHRHSSEHRAVPHVARCAPRGGCARHRLWLRLGSTGAGGRQARGGRGPLPRYRPPGALRGAQGYVRCGRCSSVFNALARLTEERQEPEGPPESAPTQPSVEESPTSTPTSVASAPGEARENDAPPPPPPPAVSDEDAIPDDALEFDPARTDASSVFVEPAPSPEWSA